MDGQLQSASRPGNDRSTTCMRSVNSAPPRHHGSNDAMQQQQHPPRSAVLSVESLRSSRGSRLSVRFRSASFPLLWLMHTAQVQAIRSRIALNYTRHCDHQEKFIVSATCMRQFYALLRGGYSEAFQFAHYELLGLGVYVKEETNGLDLCPSTNESMMPIFVILRFVKKLHLWFFVD